MPGDAFLRLENVSVAYGRVQALREVSLEIGSDELVVVLGPTGAGKTTLLRTIAGLEDPHAGRIVMGRQDITRDSPAARDVALVFQDFSLYPNWTVRANLEFPLRAPGRKLTRAEIDRRVAWAAGILKIDHLLDRRSVRLSGGEMQRVAIGRAIVRRPRIFLMDEPLTNLDAKLREALRVELVCLRRELKTPMLFVTHDQVEALSMGDRVVVLWEGRVLQAGTPAEIYDRPVSPVVARQIGQPAINLLPVTCRDGWWVTPAGIPVAPAEGAPDAAAMILGIRPEHVGTAGGKHPATVRVVENMGPVKILLAQWGDASVHIIAPGSGANLRPGDVIYPKIDAARVLLWPRR
ncbi:MAG TPA: ABC transporter ATP-binding protein [Planctomycetota bacterium]|nr:ABC transporter ATP-binding protein [Planctomycetota bacterium]